MEGFPPLVYCRLWASSYQEDDKSFILYSIKNPVSFIVTLECHHLYRLLVKNSVVRSLLIC